MARDDQGRRVGRNFASLRATFSRSTITLHEVPGNETVKNSTVEENKPAPKPKLPERRQSKYTLFDLFSKPKVQTARGYHETGIQAVPEQSRPPPKQLPVVEEKSLDVEERVEARPSRKQAPPPLQPVQAPAIEESRIEQPQTVDYWGAPPLFQAYPQSIKHGTLQCPSVSMDALVRAQTLRKQAGFLGNSTSLPAVRENSDIDATQDSNKSVSRRFSTINDTPELMDKVFVLVTAGRLVQYAGDGNYDRMPEKVLQLGEKSAAFVCDLIPGKHFVVQVVQQVNPDVSGQISKSRSILSRFRNPAANRKSTANVLLVFSSAEDMAAWLQAIRSVIENLGGAKKKDDGEACALDGNNLETVAEEQLSHRYRVSRPTSMISNTTSNYRRQSTSSFSQPRSPRSPVDMELPPVPSNAQLSFVNSPGSSPRDVNFPAEVQSLMARRASNSPMDSSVASSDHIRLERLQEGSRTSEISTRTSQTSDTDHGTIPTSKCSSSPPSPHVDTFAASTPITSDTPMRTSYIAPTNNIRRFSIQPVSPLEITKVETITRLPQSPQEKGKLASSSPPEPKLADDYTLKLENPRSRTSEVYPHTMPARLRLSETSARRKSDMMEPWDKPARPDSIVGQLPSIPSRTLSRIDSTSRPRRPLSRMLPVRPSDPNSAPLQRNVGPGPAFYPRRYSSLPTTGTADMSPEIPRTDTPVSNTPSLSLSSNSPKGSSTTSTPEQLSKRVSAPVHRERMPSLPLIINTPSNPSQQAAQQTRALRRPTSMQIRSDPAPFLSQRRPSISSRSSPPAPASNSYFAGSMPKNDFLPSSAPKRASSVGFRAVSAPAMKPAFPIAPPSISEQSAYPPVPTTAPPIPPMNPSRSMVRTRASMPSVMFSGLPPPAPPPNMPLPSLPPNIALPSPPPNVPLPSLPPNIPLPSLPPNIPLPPIPTHSMAP